MNFTVGLTFYLNMWTDRLTFNEAQYTEKVLNLLNDVPWAKGLLERIHRAGGLKSENMPLLFEARYAYELHRVGCAADYEYATGVGGSTVEFRVHSSPEWIVELVSIRPSKAIKRATRQIAPFYVQKLSTKADDVAQSEEAEMITAEQKIGEKVFADGEPTKFPLPRGAYHFILTDVRGYLDQGGDHFDYGQMACGHSGIPPDKSSLIHFWEIEPGKREPIKGLFEKSNPLQSAKYIQERIHFLGFVREEEYKEGEITGRTWYFANPHLFQRNDENEAYKTYPLSKR